MEQETALFDRVIIALDRPDSGCGAWHHGMDWAKRLHLPAEALLFEKPDARDLFAGGFGHFLARQIERVFDTREVRRRLDPTDLVVLGHASPPPWKKRILHQLLRSDGPAVLLCPEERTTLTRALLVHAGNDLEGGFLTRALQVCRLLGVRPVVLTVGRSERVARLQEQRARRTLGGNGIEGEFDYLVGPEIGAAVAGVARWRRCPLVMIEHEVDLSWWRWLRGRPSEELLKITDNLAFLALPGKGRVSAPPQGTPLCG